MSGAPHRIPSRGLWCWRVRRGMVAQALIAVVLSTAVLAGCGAPLSDELNAVGKLTPQESRDLLECQMMARQAVPDPELSARSLISDILYGGRHDRQRMREVEKERRSFVLLCLRSRGYSFDEE